METDLGLLAHNPNRDRGPQKNFKGKLHN